MCDESDDITINKKPVVFARFIPKEGDFEPVTLYLDNVSIDKGDAETIYNNLKSSALSKGIDMKKVMYFG